MSVELHQKVMLNSTKTYFLTLISLKHQRSSVPVSAKVENYYLEAILESSCVCGIVVSLWEALNTKTMAFWPWGGGVPRGILDFGVFQCHGLDAMGGGGFLTELETLLLHGMVWQSHARGDGFLSGTRRSRPRRAKRAGKIGSFCARFPYKTFIFIPSDVRVHLRSPAQRR